MIFPSCVSFDFSQSTILFNKLGSSGDNKLIEQAETILKLINLDELAAFYGQQANDPERARLKKDFDQQLELVINALHKMVIPSS